MIPHGDQRSLFAARGDSSKRPTAAAQLLPRFKGALRSRGWVAGPVLAVELGSDLRALRDAAHESRGYIISGNAGYHLTLEASLTDVQKAVARLYSQSREMRERGMEIERVRHGSVSDFSGGAA